LLDRHETK